MATIQLADIRQIAEVFNPSKSGGYTIGEHCIYQGLYYKCIIPHTGAWNASHFEQVKVGDEISAIKDDLNDIEDSIGNTGNSANPDLLPRTFKSTKGYYYKTGYTQAHTWKNNSEYSTTELIAVTNAEKVHVFNSVRETQVSSVQFWNSNEEIISTAGCGAGGSVIPDNSLHEYDVPANTAYVSYTCETNKCGESYIYYGSVGNSIADQINGIKDVLETETSITGFEVTENICLYRDGVLTSNSSYKVTDYIPCQCGDKFILQSKGVGGSIYTKAYYDSSKVMLCCDNWGTGITTALQTEEFTVFPVDAAYIRVCAAKSGDIILTKKTTGKKVDLYQGTANAGKAMVVDENGNVSVGAILPSIDTTLTQSGKSADAKATGDKINVVETTIGNAPTYDDVQPRTFGSTKGFYYKTGDSSEHQWHDSTDYLTTNKLPLGDAVHIVVYTVVSKTSASRIQFWDNNDTMISDYGAGASGESTWQKAECDVPSGAYYVSYTCYLNYAGQSSISFGKITKSIYDTLDDIEETIKSEQNVSVDMIETGAFYRDGTILSSSAYKLSDYVPCSVGDKFIVGTYGGNSTIYSKAFYDENKNVLYFDHFFSVATEGTVQEEEFTVTAETAKYVRFTCYGGFLQCVKISSDNSGEDVGIIALNRQALDDVLAAGINRGRFTGVNNPDSFMLLHFSDIHGTGENLINISKVQKHLEGVLDDTLCTGDIMKSNWSNSFDFWDASTDGSILTCIGNHDVKASNAGGTGYLTNQESEATLYGRYMENYIADWNVEHSSTNLYYYKDYADKKIRLIVLNLLYPTSEKVAEQNTWLATALAGAKTAGYGVVIGEHYYPVSGTKISCTFSAEINFPNTMSNPENYMYNGNALTTYQATVQDFIDGGGNFVCWLCGHKHADYIEYHPTYPKQTFIGVGGALFTERSQETDHTSDMRRIRGTRSQDCMNVLSIDPTGKIIKIIRIGCDRDFLSRHRGVLTLDYSTSPATVVYND